MINQECQQAIIDTLNVFNSLAEEELKGEPYIKWEIDWDTIEKCWSIYRLNDGVKETAVKLRKSEYTCQELADFLDYVKVSSLTGAEILVKFGLKYLNLKVQ